MANTVTVMFVEKAQAKEESSNTWLQTPPQEVAGMLAELQMLPEMESEVVEPSIPLEMLKRS